MRAAYYCNGGCGASALTGAGQAIGLFEFDGYNIGDVVSSFYGMANATETNATSYLLDYTPPAGGGTYSIPINNVLLDNTTGAPTDGDDDAEEVLDIVQAISMSPGLSQVRVYIGNNDADIFNQMATDNLCKQLSVSWSWNPDDPSTDDFFFQEYAAQGQSVFVASGDYGAFAPSQIYVDFFYPAEDAWVTSVGGTSLVTNGAGGGWESETGWLVSGGGISPDSIPIPNWQSGMANSFNGGSTALRNEPDVAAEADYDNYSCSNNDGCLETWAGTSFAAPRWAAFTALVNQQSVATGNPTVGFANPTIYAIGEGPDYDSAFHDITIGTNYIDDPYLGFSVGYNAVPGYDLVTGWGSPNYGSINDLAPQVSTAFQLSASPSSLTIVPGNSGATTITVQEYAGFNGSVTLGVSGLPSGVTASWTVNPTTGTSILTLTASSSAIRGSYLVTVTGIAGVLTSTTTFALEVSAPGFSIVATNGSNGTRMEIQQGISATFAIKVIDYAGFDGKVTLAVTSPLPSGVTASWGANPTYKSSTLTLSASDTAALSSTMVTITGTSGNLSATTTIALTVSAPLFYLGISPYPFTIVPGSSTVSTISVVPVGDFNDTVALSTPVLPPGVTAQFTPASITTGATSLLTLTASSSAQSSWLQIEGDSSNSIFIDNIQQTTVSATPTFTVGVSPAFLTVAQGGSVTGSVAVSELYGFTGSVNLTVSYLPKGVTATLSPNPATGISVLTLTASSSTVAGFYDLKITGTGQGKTTYEDLYLTVNPPLPYTPTTTTLTSSLNPSAYGQSVTFTAQVVSNSSGTPPNGELVYFMNNASTLIGSAILQGGLASITTSTLAAGSYSITAVYNGDSTFVGSMSSALSQAIQGAPPTTTLTLSPNPSTTGQDVTFTATVASSSGTPPDGGNIEFLNSGSTLVGWGVLQGGSASFTTSALAAGSYSITAVYGGGSMFYGSTSTAETQVVSNGNPPTSATVTLGSMTQTYTGSPLSPTVTTAPPGLSYSLSGAPQTNAGSYSVAATITDPNYSGAASGTFVIDAPLIVLVSGVGTVTSSPSGIYCGSTCSSVFAPGTQVTLNATAGTVSSNGCTTYYRFVGFSGCTGSGNTCTVTTTSTGLTVTADFQVFKGICSQ
jgi:hypothetical protein